MKIRLLLPILLALASCRPAALPPPASVFLASRGEVGMVAAKVIPELHLSKPVEVADEELKALGFLGMTRDLDGEYLITLDPTLTDLEREMVLVHELAHAVVMDSHAKVADAHGPEWALAQGVVWGLWVK
jgi:hypothetical protein